MEYSFGAAIVAGVVGTVVMTALLYMGLGMMPRQMTMNLLYMLGTMMTGNKVMAYGIGTMMHGTMGIAFGLIHIAVFQALGLVSAVAAWGLLFGFVHYLIVGMGMGMMGTMHPLMRNGQMPAPGLYVRNFPAMTVMGFLMLHLVYGLVVALLYQALV